MNNYAIKPGPREPTKGPCRTVDELLRADPSAPKPVRDNRRSGAAHRVIWYRLSEVRAWWKGREA